MNSIAHTIERTVLRTLLWNLEGEVLLRRRASGKLAKPRSAEQSRNSFRKDLPKKQLGNTVLLIPIW